MGPLPFDVTRSPRRRRRDAAGALATREKSRSTQADPNKKTKADQQREAKARARARVLKGGPLEKKEVRGLSVSELETFLFAMGVVVSRTARSKKARQVALESWFDAHGGRPFVLSEDRAGELRRIWPDAEARAALLPEKRKAAAPPPDAELLARYEACGARVGLPSRPLTRATAGTNSSTTRRTPRKRPPNRPKSSGSAIRRPCPSNLSTDAPSDVRRHGGLRRGRSNGRETARRESETPRDARN